jgi:tetratricopeptide (TPR) repeat protein
MSFDDDIKAWAKEERSATAPSPAEAAELVTRARRPQFGWLTIALPALGALLLLAVLLPGTPAPAPAELTAAPPADQSPKTLAKTLLEVGETEIGGDRFTLAADSAAELVERGPTARVALSRGSIEVKAAKRSPGESLTITANDYQVQVVGTQFVVHADPFAIFVSEGLVRVADSSGGEWMLAAGEGFSKGKTIREKTIREKTIREKTIREKTIREKGLPDIAIIRASILTDEFEAAREALEAHLVADEQRVDAWMLLAQLENRMGEVDAAVEAWDSVIEHGSSQQAQQGRYEAARLLEEQPRRALPYLEAFLSRPDSLEGNRRELTTSGTPTGRLKGVLSSPDPLEGEARLRLAQALHETARTEEAKAELEQLISAHPGTGAAKKAKKMLTELVK